MINTVLFVALSFFERSSATAMYQEHYFFLFICLNPEAHELRSQPMKKFIAFVLFYFAEVKFFENM